MIKFYKLHVRSDAGPVFMEVDQSATEHYATDATIHIISGCGNDRRDITVAIYYHTRYGAKKPTAQVNWSAMGGQNCVMAETYGQLICHASEVAAKWPTLPYMAKEISLDEINQWFDDGPREEK